MRISDWSSDVCSSDLLLDDWPVERRLLVCAEWGEARPIAEALQAIRAGSPGDAGPWAIMTGPEGGFAESELDALRKLPFVTPVGLGARKSTRLNSSH